MSIRFDPSRGLIVVPVGLSGPAGNTTARLALDTGAAGSLVSWEIVVLLGYDPAGTPERVHMVTGSLD